VSTPFRRRSRRTVALISLAVAGATSVGLSPTTPVAAAPGDVVLTESFDSGALPAGWTPVVGQWSVENGRLVSSPAGIGRITFGPHLDNFRVEATMRFEQVANASRWAGIMLDVPADGSVPWWQGIMRSATTASNGIEIATRTAANTWSVPYTASAPHSAGTGRDIHVAIEVRGSQVTWIFDGQEVLEGRIDRSDDGVLGFVQDGSRVSIDDVIVTEIEPPTHVGDDGELPVTVAHRGYSSVLPENTLAAYLSAMRAGADFVEIDVHTSADGVPVVSHDQTVDRTTDGTGDVAALPSSYLATLDAGSWFHSIFAAQKLPTFAQMLELVESGSSDMLLEIKGPETSAEVERVVDMIVAAGLEDRVVIQSFDTNVLRFAREHAPQIERGLLRGTIDADPVAVARDLDVVMYNPAANALLARPSVVTDLNAAGVAVMPYTIDSANAWAQLTAIGVDGIITNRPAAFIGWKDARRQEPPEPAPTVQILSPAAATEIEVGENVVIAAAATGADTVTLTLDGQTVVNGAVVPAAGLLVGQHTVVAAATGPGGAVETTATFSVTVTADGLRARLAALDVSTGQLQQLLTALEQQDWTRLRDALTAHTDPATAAALSAQVDVLAAG
jgi:glycerophosphoryl diester phosphodiesterase